MTGFARVRRTVSEGEITKFLQGKKKGLSMDKLAEHFGAAREQLEEPLRRLEGSGRIKFDDDHEVVRAAERLAAPSSDDSEQPEDDR